MSRMTAQQQREKALLGAIGKHTAEMGLRKDCDIANHIGMSPQSYAKYRAKNFQIHGLLVFSLIARRLGFTGREVCAIVGVPYEDKEGG